MFITTNPKAEPVVGVLDIETRSTRVNAAIGSIGLVIGNVLTRQVYESFYVLIDHEAQTNRDTSARTMDWWAVQAEKFPDAHDEMFNNPDRVSLKDALIMLNEFVDNVNQRYMRGGRTVNVFGNGPEFDNAIVCDAMDDARIKPKWQFGSNQSIRTGVYFERLLTDGDSKYSNDFPNKHHALYDAQHEFEYLCDIVANIVGMRDIPQRGPTLERDMALLPVECLQPGMKLDLAGDRYADPGSSNTHLDNQYVTIERLERETESTILVVCDEIQCGFPPSHRVKVQFGTFS
jgi:hypothetical protein